MGISVINIGLNCVNKALKLVPIDRLPTPIALILWNGNLVTHFSLILVLPSIAILSRVGSGPGSLNICNLLAQLEF